MSGGSDEASEWKEAAKGSKLKRRARQHRSLSPWAAPTILLLVSVQLLECTKLVRTMSAICSACIPP